MFDSLNDVGDMIGAGARTGANYFKTEERISTAKLNAVTAALKDAEVLTHIYNTTKVDLVKRFKSSGYDDGDNIFDSMVLKTASKGAK